MSDLLAQLWDKLLSIEDRHELLGGLVKRDDQDQFNLPTAIVRHVFNKEVRRKRHPSLRVYINNSGQTDPTPSLQNSDHNDLPPTPGAEDTHPDSEGADSPPASPDTDGSDGVDSVLDSPLPEWPDSPTNQAITLDEVKHILYSLYTHKHVRSKPVEGSRSSKVPGVADYAIHCYNTWRVLCELLNKTEISLSDIFPMIETTLTTTALGKTPESSTAQKKLAHILTLFGLFTIPEKIRFFGSIGCYEEQHALVQEWFYICKEKVKARDAFQELTDAEKAQWIEWSDLLSQSEKFIQEIPISEITDDDDSYTLARTLFLLYVYVIDHPPRRLEVFDLMTDDSLKIEIEYDNNANPPKPVKMIYKVYKTSDVYGDYHFDLSDDASRLLAMLVKWQRQHGKKFILGNTDGDIDKTRVLQDSFNAVCGKSLSCNLLRKIKINHEEQDGGFKLAKQGLALATLMGHSVNAQQNNYLRNTENLQSSSSSGKRKRSDDEEQKKRQKIIKTILHKEIDQWVESQDYQDQVRDGKTPLFPWTSVQSRHPELAGEHRDSLRNVGKRHRTEVIEQRKPSSS
ncbi:hypothetical protein BC832DRAFT_591262 [Gaertneriomyces semiglobifer]|nr:hypothetical protein BC832DRAFT_591262 [Gaertneriomyces semiglobifer]